MQISVLIVDDSPIFREALRDLLGSDPAITVVGTAANGQEAVEMTERLQPDLITMDIRMPVMDGLEAIEQIMADHPTPILVVTEDVSERLTFQALERGALELIRKPGGPGLGLEGTRAREELRSKVKLLSSIRVVRHVAGARRRRVSTHEPRERHVRKHVVAIAGSTGGPRALLRVLSSLPADFPAGLLVVQHISRGFSLGLAEWLDQECAIRVRLARSGDSIEPALALVAPEDRHMLVTSGGRIDLDGSAPLEGHRPSATLLFRSVASVFGARATGLIMTGMGSDGAEGLHDIYRSGGMTIAQDAATSTVFGMPRAAVELGAARVVLPLEEIPRALRRAVCGS